ncbi:MAG: hypothetical protein KGR26_03340 [Cyanobacteria bacterium REEB65]|nr:hypothetical protein [Cyanobacteria bacterium REEB65]
MRYFALMAAPILCASCASSANLARNDLTSRNPTGKAEFFVPLKGNRTVQYLASDINGIGVTILDAINNSTVSWAYYEGSSLSTHLIGNLFTFSVDNLKVNDGTHQNGYSYNAKVDAYLDASASIAIGSTTTSSPFTVSNNQTTVITSFPSLDLDATPIGNATATSSNAVSIVDNSPPAVTFN